ncbi:MULTISPECIES: glutaminase [Pseudanabaena]|uniref:glutaminase n=2 Tax=Pseudanabaena TaxID=1152 RepID=L8MVM1_9CYAN|nr:MULTISPECIES: glutaminase [Pseudanabaena]ELS32007.1 L-glutaminase [Pseudanabaena biceps PCC 7429]MDG3495752.1 glutaminase [Pseudanabaena catenata USMAC16]
MLADQLPQWLELALQEIYKGKLPSYIPLLAQADPRTIAIAIQSIDGNPLMAGDTTATFPLMSAIKPFLLLYLCENFDKETVFQMVDAEPSTEAFNAIPDGKPKNPMINSGAIALSSLLTSSENLQNWLNQRSGANLILDFSMLSSVRSVPNRRNLAIASQLTSLGIVSNSSQALRVYEEICCLRGNVQDLAKIGGLLIDTQRSPHIPMVLEIMLRCGMYEGSAAFAQDVGLASKSSVSGALLSIIPDRAVIACYSPALDAIGNSVAGLFLVRKIKNYILELGHGVSESSIKN